MANQACGAGREELKYINEQRTQPKRELRKGLYMKPTSEGMYRSTSRCRPDPAKAVFETVRIHFNPAGHA